MAGQQVYTYAIIHPTYGEIGTFTDMIDRNRDGLRIHSRMHVAVTLLGIVVYRQESDITEIMSGNRLLSLESVTEKDGRHVEVHGEVQGDMFVVKATAGSFAGPATIAPSDPWLIGLTGEKTVVLTDTGRIINVHISGGEYDTISISGVAVFARHFVVMGDKRQDVWFDNQGIPVMFRDTDKGTPVDFVLQSPTAEAGAVAVAYAKRPAVPQLGNSGK